MPDFQRITNKNAEFVEVSGGQNQLLGGAISPS